MDTSIHNRNLCPLTAGLFKNGLLGSIIGHKWEGVIGGWRKFYNSELHNLYFHKILLGLSYEGG